MNSRDVLRSLATRATDSDARSLPRPPSRGSCYFPHPVEVGVGAGGAPHTVAGVGVNAVREEWVVEDRWWTSTPLRRRYFELALADGRCVVVFRELEGGSWFTQRS